MSEKSFALFMVLAAAVLVVLMSTPLSTSALNGLFGRVASQESSASTLSLARR